MQIRSAHDIFPDFLSLTFNPDTIPDGHIRSLLLDLDFRVHGSIKAAFVPPDGFGLVRFFLRPRFTSVTFSGGALGHVRRFAAVGNLLQVLTLAPHRVTRLDLAKDLEFDSASDVSRRLTTLWDRARKGFVSLGRKGVPREKISRVESVRADGSVTGTVYCGSRKDRYFAKAYDKRAEAWARRSIDIGRELVRVEVTASRGTASLRDFLEPDSLFFYLASPDFLPAPLDVPEWRSLDMDPLTLPELATLTDHEKIIRLIENSTDLETLRLLIAQRPAELPIVLRKLEAKLRADGRIAA